MSDKLVVIGLDGATWDLLQPMIDQGRLPTLARIAEEGVRGDLESVRPPISCPAWYCYSTGKNPGKLGIYGWRNFDPATHTDRFNDYKLLEEPEIWDHVGQAGLKSAVLNIPTHFPPKSIPGYMVSGMQAEDHQDYTHPPELKQRLVDELDYRVGPRHKMKWDPEAAYEDIVGLFPKRLEAARMLLDEVDLLHVTIFHIDEIQHEAWGTPELEAAWERIDELLASFLEDLPEGTDVLFMSDHGFAPRNLKLNINTWLEQEGYLTRTENRLGEALRRVGITRSRLQRLLERTGTLKVAKALTPESLQHKVQEADGSTSNQRRLPEIDWERTVAFASTNFTLHVLDPGKIDEIIEKLETLETPAGEPVFEEVLRADEVLSGHRMEQAPQILFVPAKGMAVGDGLGKDLWDQLPATRAGHHLHGIVMAHGPSFKQATRLEGAKLTDLAPTILHTLGLPVPKDMDGQVLEILAEERPVELTGEQITAGAFSEQELEKVEERLRGLGYLE